jgi:hypothetical protein
VTNTTVDTPAPTLAPTETREGWHEDPFGQHRMRYHTGADWTEFVTHFGPTPCPGCGSAGRLSAR